MRKGEDTLGSRKGSWVTALTRPIVKASLCAESFKSCHASLQRCLKTGVSPDRSVSRTSRLTNAGNAPGVAHDDGKLPAQCTDLRSGSVTINPSAAVSHQRVFSMYVKLDAAQLCSAMICSTCTTMLTILIITMHQNMCQGFHGKYHIAHDSSSLHHTCA